jgi:ribonuclease BN (tRNA processing enzyme)
MMSLRQCWPTLMLRRGRSGVLDPDKAIALGVKPGRAFAQLKAGQAVETAAGRTVQPSEVWGLSRRPCNVHICSRQGGAADLWPARL